MTNPPELYLLTAAALAGLSPDDQVLLAALTRRGVAAQPVVWEDPLIDWSRAPITLIRSTWDYAYRLSFFLEVLEAASRCTSLLNPIEILHWNSHKSYLLDLSEKGIETVPTLLLRRSEEGAREPYELLSMVEEHDVVIKPAVGAGGKWTARAARGDALAAVGHAERVLLHEDALVQPFLSDVMSRGEVSIVLIDGIVSHAVRKRGARGDFRVHSEYGGTVEAVDVTPAFAQYASRVLAALPEIPFYARIDVIESQSGALLLMEAELIEPELFFAHSSAGTELFVDRVLRRLRG